MIIDFKKGVFLCGWSMAIPWSWKGVYVHVQIEIFLQSLHGSCHKKKLPFYDGIWIVKQG